MSNKITFRDLNQAIFIDKTSYLSLTDNDKESLFFIFNRYMAKKYPLHANAFNKKGVYTPLALDVWFNFFSKQPNKFPEWFFKKKDNNKNNVFKIDGFNEIESYLLKNEYIATIQKNDNREKILKKNLKIKKIKK
jgi:hypothetical protein